MPLDHTHDPALTSWVESANAPDTDFPIQNLPHGVFRRRGSHEPFRGGVAIGDCILDITAAAAQHVFAPTVREAVQAASADALNGLMALGPSHWHALRAELSRLLRHELRGGVRRGYLEDGDTVILRAWGERPGAARIGFGDCRATVLPTRATSP